MIEPSIIVSLQQQDWFLPKYIQNDCDVVVNEDILIQHNPKCASNKYIGFKIEYAELISGKVCAVCNYNGSQEGWSSPITSSWSLQYDLYNSLEDAEQFLLLELHERLLTRKDKVADACVKFIEKHLKEKYNLCQVQK